MESSPVVVKLGGSLLTDPDQPESFRTSRTLAAAEALTAVDGPIVIVHGTGSFGKPPAEALGFEDGFLGPNRADAFAKMERRLDELRARVLAILAEAELRAVRLTPAALFRSEEGRIVRTTAEPVRSLLERGVSPVLSGGFVTDENRGFAVCSSDDQAAHLARALEADRLIYATSAPGVQDRSTGASDRNVSTYGCLDRLPLTRSRIDEVTESAPDDVSGGMRGKLLAARVAVDAGIPTWVVDGRVPHRIPALTRGESVRATRLLPARTGHTG